MSELTIRELIDSGLYEKDLSEPTPLEKKGELVREVKSEFISDLLSRGIHLETINLAWLLSEDINGEDEALNSGFLHSVMKYIDILEEYVEARTNEV